MRISDAARAAGCSVRAVRHYHTAGALPEPARTHGGYRDYSLADLADLLRVRALVQAGIPLSAISDPDPSLYDAALARIDAHLTALHEQRRHLLTLRSGTLGLPADLREMITAIGRDSDYLRLELDSLELMGLCGVATDETWERMRANLADPSRRAEYRRAFDLWNRLGSLKSEDPAVDGIIDDLSGLTRAGLMSGVWETLRPGNLPVSSRDYETRGAQTRALAEISGQS